MRALAGAAIVAGAASFLYAFAGWITHRHDALADALLIGVALPALPPVVLGAFLLAGRRWALHGLRAHVALLLLGGAWLTWGVGVGVFSFAPFAVPFVGACIVWLWLSFAMDRRTAGDRPPDRPPGAAPSR